MFNHPILNILSDNRLMSAINSNEVKATGRPFLDIVMVVIENLPLILESVSNPAALIALIVSLLGQLPHPTPAPTPTPAA